VARICGSVEEHHLADRAQHVPARVGIVAYVSYAIWRQVLPADIQDPVLHRLGDPGVNAVDDDVVKDSQFRRDVQNVHVPQTDVRQAQDVQGRLAVGDLGR
jgi:hypothetical protein